MVPVCVLDVAQDADVVIGAVVKISDEFVVVVVVVAVAVDVIVSVANVAAGTSLKQSFRGHMTESVLSWKYPIHVVECNLVTKTEKKNAHQRVLK